MLRPSNLGAHTGYRLRLVSNAVSQDFARRLENEGVTVAEWALLRTLYDVDAMSPSLLAEKMGLTKGAISKLSDRLIGKRLAGRTGNPDDKRACNLFLTDLGRDKVPILAIIADEIETDYFGALTNEERTVLVSILNSLAERRGLSIVPVN